MKEGERPRISRDFNFSLGITFFQHSTNGGGIVKAWIGVLGAMLLLSSCQATAVLRRQPLEREGEVYVYISPFPQEAARLKFSLEAVSVLREDGATHPLRLVHPEIRGDEMQRERLLASGILPPGRYTDLVLRVKKASLKQEGGEGSLLLSEEAPRSSIHFSIVERHATVLSLVYRHPESLREEVRFTPVFSGTISEKLATGLIGMVTNRGSHDITIFDKMNGKVSAVISTGKSPEAIRLDPVRRQAYVALSGEDAVDVIDLLGGEILRRIHLNPGDKPRDAALSPDGRTLLTANSGSDTVSVIDLSALAETARLPVGNGPQAIVLDRAGRRGYAINALSNSVTVIDVPGRQVVTTIGTEAGPVRGDFNRDGTRFYILHQGSPYLLVLDPSLLSVVKRIYVGLGGSALKVDPRTDRIYLAKGQSDIVDVYDPFSLLPGDFIRAGGAVASMTIDGEGNNLCLALSDKNIVKLVQLVGKQTLSEIDVGEDPSWVTLMGER